MVKSNRATEVEFLAALGGAVNDWQLVEMALCRLFEAVMRAPDPRVAAEAFYAVQSFRDKLAMVDVAVRFTLWQHPTLVPEWESLRKRIERRSKRRNAIVHAHTWSEHVGGGDIEHRLGPHNTLLKMTEADQSPQRAYTDTKQLIEAARSFRDLATSIHKYLEPIRELLAPRR